MRLLASGRSMSLRFLSRRIRQHACSARASSAAAAAAKGGRVDPDTARTSDEIRMLRAEKAAKLREAGTNPFAYSFSRSNTAHELQQAFQNLPNGEEAPEDVQVSVAGRVMMRRVMGKLAFVSLRDDSGVIQLYIDKGRLEGPLDFKSFKALVDAGDFVGVTGGLRRTDKGELSVVARSMEVLTKSHRMLPDKHKGLQDIEKRYRQRYLDLICNPDVKATFRARSRIVSAIRAFLEGRGFLEMETPVLEPMAGGADARPFETFHNALDRPFTLRIATELHLKRLMVGGFERVFELGRVFRNEGVSTRHNPEFTSVEVYQAYADYSDMMLMTEELVRHCAQAALEASTIRYGEVSIDLSQPFRRAAMHELVREATGIDFWSLHGDVAATRAAAVDALAAQGAGAAAQKEVERSATCGHIVNALFEELVEGELQQPTFVTDHPEEISPLAKPHRQKEGLVERFELFVVGRELANSFSELTDPIEQRRRLEAQVDAHRQRRAAGGAAEADLAYDVQLDTDFITALEYGMPPAAGMGLGVDRLVMLLTNSASIRDVIAFPLLK